MRVHVAHRDGEKSCMWWRDDNSLGNTVLTSCLGKSMWHKQIWKTTLMNISKYLSIGMQVHFLSLRRKYSKLFVKPCKKKKKSILTLQKHFPLSLSGSYTNRHRDWPKPSTLDLDSPWNPLVTLSSSTEGMEVARADPLPRPTLILKALASAHTVHQPKMMVLSPPLPQDLTMPMPGHWLTTCFLSLIFILSPSGGCSPSVHTPKSQITHPNACWAHPLKQTCKHITLSISKMGLSIISFLFRFL